MAKTPHSSPEVKAIVKAFGCPAHLAVQLIDGKPKLYAAIKELGPANITFDTRSTSWQLKNTNAYLSDSAIIDYAAGRAAAKKKLQQDADRLEEQTGLR